MGHAYKVTTKLSICLSLSISVNEIWCDLFYDRKIKGLSFWETYSTCNTKLFCGEANQDLTRLIFRHTEGPTNITNTLLLKSCHILQLYGIYSWALNKHIMRKLFVLLEERNQTILKNLYLVSSFWLHHQPAYLRRPSCLMNLNLSRYSCGAFSGWGSIPLCTAWCAKYRKKGCNIEFTCWKLFSKQTFPKLETIRPV